MILKNILYFALTSITKGEQYNEGISERKHKKIILKTPCSLHRFCKTFPTYFFLKFFFVLNPITTNVILNNGIFYGHKGTVFVKNNNNNRQWNCFGFKYTELKGNSMGKIV